MDDEGHWIDGGVMLFRAVQMAHEASRR